MTENRNRSDFMSATEAIDNAHRERRSALRTILRGYREGDLDIDDVAELAAYVDDWNAGEPVSHATAYRRIREWSLELRDEWSTVNPNHRHIWGCMGTNGDPHCRLSCMCGEPGPWISEAEAEAIFG